MKATVEVYKDVCIIKITDDSGIVTDRYETENILVKNHQYEKKYADPEGTLPITTKKIQ